MEQVLRRKRAIWLAGLCGCIGLALIASPALAGGARTSAGTAWLTGGNTVQPTDFLGTLTATPLIFKTNNAERMRISSGGSVGIGTTSPNDLLSLKTATGRYGLTHTDGKATVGTWVGAGTSPVTVPSGWFGTKSNSPLQFFTGNQGTQMTLATNGNVGIGTPTPPYRLTVKTPGGGYGIVHTDGTTSMGTYLGSGTGWFGTSSVSPLNLMMGSSARMTLATNGNVGVGTSAPADRLSVSTSTNSYGVTQSDGQSTVGTWIGAGSSGLASGWFGTKTNSPLRLFTANGAAPLNVYPSGEVGIGSYLVYGTKLSARSSSVDVARFENTAGGRAITANSATGQAILGRAESTTNGIGVYGYSVDGTGVYGYGPTSTGYAGYFQGNVKATGSYFAAQDNPIDPANKTLNSAPVSANQRLNVYSGNVVTGSKGEAVVRLPAYYSAANKDPRYQLTVIGQFAQAIVAREIANNRFTIRTDRPNVKVSWQVTGVRNDAVARAHPFQAVQEKHGAMRGKYYDPAAYGKSKSASIAPAPSAAVSRAHTPKR
jgi:hypothetical protein